MRSTARWSRLYRSRRPSWYMTSLVKVRARVNPRACSSPLCVDLRRSVALVDEELRAAPVERASLDDEHLGLLAGLQQPEDLVLGAAFGEPRRGGALSIVLEHGSSRGCDAVRGSGPGRLAGRGDAQVERAEPSGRATVAVICVGPPRLGTRPVPGACATASHSAAPERKGIPSAAMTRRVDIVPHTHWDREWYSPFQTFRLRLVDLLDQLLPQLEADPSYAHFLLDGQMAVVDDYLAVRPEAEDAHPGAGHHRPHGHGPLVRAARRVPRVGRDARAQPAARPPGGGPLRRRDGGRLPARHVRARGADAAAVPAVRLRARGRVAGRAVGHRPQRLLVVGPRRLHRAGRVPARRATATAPSCPTTPRRSCAASASSRRSRATCSPARSSG